MYTSLIHERNFEPTNSQLHAGSERFSQYAHRRIAGTLARLLLRELDHPQLLPRGRQREQKRGSPIGWCGLGVEPLLSGPAGSVAVEHSAGVPEILVPSTSPGPRLLCVKTCPPHSSSVPPAEPSLSPSFATDEAKSWAFPTARSGFGDL